MKTLYITEYRFKQQINIAQVTAIKETEEMYILKPNDDSKHLGHAELIHIYGDIGSLPIELLKRNYFIFESKNEAIEWFIKIIKDDITRMSDNIYQSYRKIEQLKMLT